MILAGGVAHAQAQATAKPRCNQEGQQADKNEKTKYDVIIGPDGKKTFKIRGGFVLCGKVPRPDVLYGLLNSTINYEWESLKLDFLPKIIHSVEQSPF
jgi:hypothetical protein